MSDYMTETINELKLAIKVASTQDGQALACTQEWLEGILEGYYSLITTIESQKEEIKELNHRWEGEKLSKEFAWTLHKGLDQINADYLAQFKSLKAITDGLADERHDLINEVDRLKDELFDQKAITELAVKGLQWYADTDNHDNGHTRYDEDGLIKGVETYIEEDYGLLARKTLSEIARIQNE